MAAGKLTLDIVTPEGVKLSVDIDEFAAPSVRGQFVVLPGHRPMLASLATGLISYVLPGGEGEEQAGGPAPLGRSEVNHRRRLLHLRF